MILYALLVLAGLLLPAHADPSPEFADILGPLCEDPAVSKARFGVHVVDLESGETVFSRNATDPFNPASTMKVITAAAALHHLGPGFTFDTTIYTDGELDDAGVLDGNLYVQGGGDPTLVVEKLWKLVYDVKLAGVKTIDGDVIFDEEYLDQDYLLPGWDKKEDLEEGPSYFPSLSALSLNFNSVALLVGPGAEVGKPGVVVMETPAASYVEIVNETETGALTSWRWTEIEREVVDGRMRFTVKGSIPSRADRYRYYRTVSDPTSYFASAFEEMESVHGLKVTGRHKRGKTPNRAKQLTSVSSPPLGAVLMTMNKWSSNYYAELVLRALGAEVKGLPGGTAKGLDVLRAFLVEDVGIDADEFTLANGSGLSRDIELRPEHLTRVIRHMALDPRLGHEFLASMSIAGEDGTLRKRITDEPGRLRGKTGTIDGVHCLAGVMEGQAGRLYAFSFMVNDIPGSIRRVRQLHDRMARELFEISAGDAVVAGGE